MSEVTAAAERLRRIHEGDLAEDLLLYTRKQIVKDIQTVIAEHAADDSLPITEEWMDATYGERHRGNTFWKVADNIILFRHGSGFTLNRHDPHASISDITTRAQLRRLIEVLNAS